MANAPRCGPTLPETSTVISSRFIAVLFSCALVAACQEGGADSAATPPSTADQATALSTPAPPAAPSIPPEQETGDFNAYVSRHPQINDSIFLRASIRNLMRELGKADGVPSHLAQEDAKYAALAVEKLKGYCANGSLTSQTGLPDTDCKLILAIH